MDPWIASYEERVASLAKGHRRVAYFYEKPDSTTFRYRVYNMIQVLGESKEGISAAYFTGDEIGRLNRVIDLADVLVICRARYSNALRQLITRARSKGVRVLFDIDDLVFDPEYVPLLVQTADQQSYPTAW
ncbi:MAG TPA: glycosyltransferase family 1 protein, partial [Spirochaetia bacterium]|nr:glycosyltransferase family 1 protein [Spirochaetia bacterium]